MAPGSNPSGNTVDHGVSEAPPPSKPTTPTSPSSPRPAAQDLRRHDGLEIPDELYPYPGAGGLILGNTVQVPQTYDPDTYDFDAVVPRTPNAAKDSPATYAAWGRSHFGDDWFRRRERMLSERNIYVKHDAHYRARQRALRVLEHAIEKRPILPSIGRYPEDDLRLDDEVWRRLWARLSHVAKPSIGPVEPEHEQLHPHQWLRLGRKSSRWTEEMFQLYTFFLPHDRIDAARQKRENNIGTAQRDQELEDIRSLRTRVHENQAARIRAHAEFDLRMKHFDLLEMGWTKERVDKELRAAREEFDALVQELDGLTDSALSPDVTFIFAPKHRGAPDKEPATPDEGPPQRASPRSPRASPSPPDPSRKVLSGRVNKRTPPGSGSNSVSPRSASPPQPAPRRTRPRLIYTKERSCRRIAELPPLFGGLADNGKDAEPYVEKPVRKPSEAPQQAAANRAKTAAKPRGGLTYTEERRSCRRITKLPPLFGKLADHGKDAVPYVEKPVRKPAEVSKEAAAKRTKTAAKPRGGKPLPPRKPSHKSRARPGKLKSSGKPQAAAGVKKSIGKPRGKARKK